MEAGIGRLSLEGWKKKENGCGPARNPMLATPPQSSNCVGANLYTWNLSVEAENCKNGCGPARNPMLATPLQSSNCVGADPGMWNPSVEAENCKNIKTDQKDSLKRKRSRCPEKRRKRVINCSESQYYFENKYYSTWKNTHLNK